MKIELYLRSVIKPWELFSRDISNNKCIITGKECEVVHHKYPFKEIIKEVFLNTEIERKESVDQYTKEELDNLSNECLNLHYKYGAGACLTDEMHREFHREFGRNTNIGDFDLFVFQKKNDCKENIYEKYKTENTQYVVYKKENKNFNVNEIIDFNKNYIENILPNKHPEIYRLINNYLKELYIIFDDCLQKDNEEKQPISYISTRIIANMLNTKNSKRVSDRIALFTFLGFLKKVRVDDIEDKTLANKISKTNFNIRNKNGFKPRNSISILSIPKYDKNFELFMLEKYRLYRENKLTIKYMSKDYLVSKVGLEEANRVYLN